jgi:hypothetical protein
MRVYIDLNSRAFVVTPVLLQRVNELLFTRRDVVPVEVQFVRDGVVVELGAGALGQMGLKKTYDGDFLAYDNAWTKTGSGTSTIYTFGLNLATTELDAEFATDEEDSISAKVEIQWSDGGLVSSTLPCAATVFNDVIRAGDGTPTTTSLSSFTLQSPDNSQWSIAIDNDGLFSATKL